jgi:hypothetical protein
MKKRQSGKAKRSPQASPEGVRAADPRVSAPASGSSDPRHSSIGAVGGRCGPSCLRSSLHGRRARAFTRCGRSAKIGAMMRTGVLAALAVLTGCPAESGPPDQHGVVRIQFQNAEGVPQGTDPYEGTVNLEITLDYLSCLVEFYEREPSWKKEGPDGGPVFGAKDEGGEGWGDRLCDPDDPELIDCTVDEFVQVFDDPAHLTVKYQVQGPMQGFIALFGPIPLPELAECEGEGPRVRIRSNAYIRGENGNGDQVWEMLTFSDEVAAPNQGQEISIGAAPYSN